MVKVLGDLIVAATALLLAVYLDPDGGLMRFHQSSIKIENPGALSGDCH